MSRTGVECFLDVEASVDDKSDEALTDDEADTTFIDNTEVEADQGGDHLGLLRQIVAENNREVGEEVLESDDEIEDVPEDFAELGDLARLLHRRVKRPSKRLDDDLNDLLPKEDDVLYEIGCKVGLEEATVYRILCLATSTGPSLPFAKAVIANPYLPGRIYVEPYRMMSELAGRAQTASHNATSIFQRLQYKTYIDLERLARQLPALHASSIRRVPREEMLRACLVANIHRAAYEWVRIDSPRSKAGRVGFILENEADLCLLPSLSCSASEILPNQDKQENQHGCQVISLKGIRLISELYIPTVEEIEMAYRYGHLKQAHYQRLMGTAVAYILRIGDRVFLQAGECAGLIGTVMGINTILREASVYVHAEGLLLRVAIGDLRRQFCVGDRISPITEAAKKCLGSSFGWMVEDLGPDEGTLLLPDNKRSTARILIRVCNPQSGEEITAAHYEFEFAESESVSLLQMQRARTSVHHSVLRRGKAYSVNNCRNILPLSVNGVVKEVVGLHSQNKDSLDSEGLGAVRILLWDPEAGTEDHLPTLQAHEAFVRMDFRLGDEVELEDENGFGGRARITQLCDARCELWLANLSDTFRLDLTLSTSTRGPYDHHIGKPVFVRKGPEKGRHGILKTVNYRGQCTVELRVFPIRSIFTTLRHLQPADESQMYMALANVIRPATPTPDTTNDFPVHPTLDCQWLLEPIMRGIPIKLEKHGRPMVRPYHFRYAFDEDENGVPKKLFCLYNRKEDKVLPMDVLSWLPPSDINQTVVHIHGTDGQLYMTVSLEGDICEVRKAPSRRSEPKITFSRLELAQVNASRKTR